MTVTYHSGRRIQGNTSEYKVHKFTSTGTFAVTGSGDIEYLVVAGGGGAGKDGFPSGRGTGGGGAGGFRTNVSGAITGGGGSAESTYSATAQNYTITVGSGGAGGTGSGSSTVGSDGVNSSIVPASGTSIISTGGGGGGGHDDSANFEGRDGGSGGGAPNANSNSYVGKAVTNPVQGHNGGSQYNPSPYYGSGGGGAGSVGGAASNSGSGNGGLGLQSSILTGSAVFYAGGGGGHGSSSYGSGGSGIGGSGASGTGGSGTANTGSGGGSGTTAGAGGSGIVIIRYRTSSGITATGGTITTIDGIRDVKPTNIQVGSRYEETDTRKIYYRDDIDFKELDGANATNYRSDSWYEQLSGETP